MNQSLVALACGDSYGSHYEIEGLLGKKFDIDKLPDKPIYPNITDDTKMANILYIDYITHNQYNSINVLKLYKSWAIKEGNKDGIGMHTNSVLLKYKLDKNSQGNGALMRVIPFGVQLIEDGYSFNDTVEIMNEDAALTHKNSVIFTANKLALDLSINGLSVLDNKEYKIFISQLHTGHTAWVMHTLYIVITTLKKKLSFLDGFKYIVSLGGDTDTNCAIYGAIKGAKSDIAKEINIKYFLPDILK